MTHNKIRTALMDATVKIVARDGLEKLTTRSIANECGLHDTYIYRYFLDKEDLLQRTFLRQDHILNELILENMKDVDVTGLHFKEKLKLVWMPAWKLLINNKDECKFYVRYYYSPYFENAAEEFKEDNRALMDVFKSFFDTNIDVDMLYHYNIDTLLHMAMRVATGEMDYRETLDEEIFELIYSINTIFTNRVEKIKMIINTKAV